MAMLAVRGAAWSAAKTAGVSKDAIVVSAGWSSKNTFAKYYDKTMSTEANKMEKSSTPTMISARVSYLIHKSSVGLY